MKKRDGSVAQQTISRRSVLEWLGKGTALALTSPLIQACGAEGGVPLPGWPIFGAEAGNTDGSATGFDFVPGREDHMIYSSWRERTVDPQDLVQILGSWQLRVEGMVETPGQYYFSDLIELRRQNQVTDFHCVEGWSVYEVPWNGIHLSTLLEAAGPSPDATYVTFHTIDGRYNESLPLDIALEPRTLLAYGVAGNTLSLPHGFPLRVVIPRLLAYKNAKYVDRIELTDHPIEGFWVAAGYSYDGEVPESRLRDGWY